MEKNTETILDPKDLNRELESILNSIRNMNKQFDRLIKNKNKEKNIEEVSLEGGR